VTQTATKRQIDSAPPIPAEGTTGEEFDSGRTWESLFQRLRLLWNQRRALGRAITAGLLLGALLAFVLPKRFEASTQLMPPDSQSGSGTAMLAALTARTGNGMGALAGDLLGAKSSGALFIGVLRSRTVADRLIARFDLKKVYGARLEEDARRKLSENTTISEDRKSGIITMTVTDNDPKRAAAIAQSYVNELDHLVAELSTSAAHRERVFLEERLTAVKQELDQASKEFSQFASKNIAIDIKEQGKAMVEAAATLQGQLTAAQSELKGLEQIYTSNNVRVRTVQAHAQELRRQLEKLGGENAAGSAPPPGAGRSQYPSIRELPLLGVTYADLYRRTRIQEIVFETLTQQCELAKVQEAKETPSVKVLDVALAPERKSFPPRLLIMLLSTVCAFLVTAVWVLGRARWEETSPEDAGKVFATEVFQTVNAHMPWATPNGSRFHAVTHKVWLRLAGRSEATQESVEPEK
jgi:capsule polysaccharide export protein KpsE/RkpR